MNLIVAVDKNWGIGKNNDLLISIPEDMKFFKEKTINHSIIMGRKTLESFPNGNPLQNRENIVLTKNEIINKDVIVFHTVEDILSYVKNKKDVFVIGGGSIYKQFLPYCNKAYITKINKNFEADIFFPNLDKFFDWEITYQSEQKKYNDICYKFFIYEKK